MIKMYEDKQRKFKGECMVTYVSTEGADGAIKFLNGKLYNFELISFGKIYRIKFINIKVMQLRCSLMVVH